MDYVQGLEIRWSKYTAWISDGLSTQRLEIQWTKHTGWRSNGLSTHSLEIRWTMHIQPGDLMNCVYTNWRQAGGIHVTKLQMTQLQCVCAAINHTGLVSYKQI